MMSDQKNPVLNFILERGKGLSPMLILLHDHPDPDTIASGWALAFLLEKLCRVRSRLAYAGLIGRMENRMMVQVLRIPLHPLRQDDLSRFKKTALVDSQPPFQNNPHPAKRQASLVIDHHRLHSRTKADFIWVDETAGATSTLLAETLLDSGFKIPPRLATALVYGIGSETQNLIREAGPRDLSAYRSLLAKANVRSLSKIQNPPRPSSFFQTLGTAIRHAFIAGRIIGVHLGEVPSQDIVAHMADFLLTHERMRWSLATGRYQDKLFVSLRTRNPKAQAGRLLWRLLGRGTSAGGHSMIAGGSVEIGQNVSEAAWRKAEQQVVSAFLKSQGHEEPFDLQYPFGRPFRRKEEA